MQDKTTIISFVGMPGAGKSEATQYLEKKSVPNIRFGDVTDEGLKEVGLPLTEENERVFREKIRREFGMEAYAIKAEPAISKLLETHAVIVIDGMRSWQEYVYLKEKFPGLTLVCIYAEPRVRYSRLSQRKVRPLTPDTARKRDIAELTELDMGAPIAISDYLIENNEDNTTGLFERIDALLGRLGVEL